jgi:hypothetical protein
MLLLAHYEIRNYRKQARSPKSIKGEMCVIASEDKRCRREANPSAFVRRVYTP